MWWELFHITLHPDEFPRQEQLRDSCSYWKNWDLSGLTLRVAGRQTDGGTVAEGRLRLSCLSISC